MPGLKTNAVIMQSLSNPAKKWKMKDVLNLIRYD